MQKRAGDFIKKGLARRLHLCAVLIWSLVLESGCSLGGKQSLSSTAKIEQNIRRKSVKDAQIETIKQELENRPELSDTEKASAVQALENAPLSDNDEDQAANILKALGDFLANQPSLQDSEGLEKRQKALLELSVSFSSKVSKEALLAGSNPEEAMAIQKALLNEAFSLLQRNGMSSAEILRLASKELSGLPDANVDLVQKLVAVPSMEGVSELQRMLALEEGVATLRECVEASEVRDGREYFCPNGSKRVGTLAAVLAPSPLPLCTSDGEVNCIVSATGNFKAASTTGLAAKVISTASVAGVTGTVVQP